MKSKPCMTPLTAQKGGIGCTKGVVLGPKRDRFPRAPSFGREKKCQRCVVSLRARRREKEEGGGGGPRVKKGGSSACEGIAIEWGRFFGKGKEEEGEISCVGIAMVAAAPRTEATFEGKKGTQFDGGPNNTTRSPSEGGEVGTPLR